MKIAYHHLLNFLPTKPSVEELSKRLFQLGHEHEIYNDIFDMEFTPNRGDCLSLIGLARDLNPFFETNIDIPIYKCEIPNFKFDFINKKPDKCPNISFLNIKIKGEHKKYNDYLENYFSDLNIKKVNFFTDISNYVAYETGQPTHSYDYKKLSETLILDENKKIIAFEPITSSESITLDSNELVFLSSNKVLNLAGVMGGKSSSCNHNTRNALVECAYFIPESIIGKALKYNLNSDASHKFERGVDPICHDRILRRFIQIVSDHAEIEKLEICNFNSKKYIQREMDIDIIKVNKILGSEYSLDLYRKSLQSLGFDINATIKVPSYRHDISQQNDLAEELARVIGYDNIRSIKADIISNSSQKIDHKEQKIKSFLIDNGFYEVISSPFVANSDLNSIRVDNPLDSNREFLRNNITESLLNNLLFNERRQKDSIKLFEISDIYSSHGSIQKNKNLAIIASGRMGNNYLEFSKKIDESYLSSIFDKSYFKNNKFVQVSRENLKNSKSKSKVFSLEISLDDISDNIKDYESKAAPLKNFIRYKKISEYPSTYRDISFSISEPFKIDKIENLVLSYENKILKDVFIFDFYENKKLNELKLGIRFIFQSKSGTLTDSIIDSIMNDIIDRCLNTGGVSIPGFLKP
jgi:phenylalanyl-tRNA synthetase beta chain